MFHFRYDLNICVHADQNHICSSCSVIFYIMQSQNTGLIVPPAPDHPATGKLLLQRHLQGSQQPPAQAFKSSLHHTSSSSSASTLTDEERHRLLSSSQPARTDWFCAVWGKNRFFYSLLLLFVLIKYPVFLWMVTQRYFLSCCCRRTCLPLFFIRVITSHTGGHMISSTASDAAKRRTINSDVLDIL